MRTRMEVRAGQGDARPLAREVRPRRARRRRVPGPGPAARPRRRASRRAAASTTTAALAGLARVGALAPPRRPRLRRALSLPAARLDGAAPARRPPRRHAGAGRPDAGAGGDAPSASLARRVPGRLPRADRRRYARSYTRRPASATSPRHGGATGSRLRCRRFYIVDGHSHLFRAYHAVGYLSTSKGVPSHAVLILSTHAVEADPRGAARLSRHRLGSAGPDVPRRPVRRLQGHADVDARRPRPPAALRAPAVRGAAHAGGRGARLRGRRRAGHPGRAGAALPDLEIVVVSGDKDLLQLVGPRVRVLLGARPHRRARDVRRGEGARALGRRAGADRRRARAHGRLASTTSPASRAWARRPRSS